MFGVTYVASNFKLYLKGHSRTAGECKLLISDLTVSINCLYSQTLFNFFF